MVEQKTEGGFVLFEYAIREPQKEPFLLNNHKAQIRTNHQRVVTGPNGGMMHVSGIEVIDHEEFETSAEFYRWVDKDRSGNWRDDRGRTLAPFVFPSAPWAGSRDEELDPQWQRETYTRSEALQVAEHVERYQKTAERKAYVGDRRGTTLNLQVGASADDAYQLSDDSVQVTATSTINDSTAEHNGFRWTAVTIPAGATIDNAIFSVAVASSSSDEPQHQVRGHLAANPAAFTTTTNDIDGRSRTTAAVQWNSADLGVADFDVWQEWGCSTDGGAGATVEAIVQELVDQGGWASGQALVFIFEQHTNSGTRDLGTASYDQDSALAAKLDIDYTAGGGGGLSIPVAYRHYQRLKKVRA